MSSRARGTLRWIGITVVAVLAVVGAAAIVIAGGLFWVGSWTREWQEEGEAFGATVTDTACLEGALAGRGGSETGPGYARSMSRDSFLTGCLIRASETEGFCNGVPGMGRFEDGTDLDDAWYDERCPEQEDAAQRSLCMSVHVTLQAHCAGWLVQ